MKRLYAIGLFALTDAKPNWNDTSPFQALQDVLTETRAFPVDGDLVYIRAQDGSVMFQFAPFDVFHGEGFEIISRRFYREPEKSEH